MTLDISQSFRDPDAARALAETMTEEALTRLRAHQELGAEDRTQEERAEDFSVMLQQLPGAMVLLGVRPPGEGPPAPSHSNRMLLNEEGMQAGIALHAAIALRYLE